jgi:hypothetical protein
MFTVCAETGYPYPSVNHPRPFIQTYPYLDERMDVDGPSETTDSTEWMRGSTGWSAMVLLLSGFSAQMDMTCVRNSQLYLY